MPSSPFLWSLDALTLALRHRHVLSVASQDEVGRCHIRGHTFWRFPSSSTHYVPYTSAREGQCLGSTYTETVQAVDLEVVFDSDVRL